MNIYLSELDEIRFGTKTAKITIEAKDNIENIIEWCELEEVQMLIARCSSDDMNLVQSMERLGFFLTDTLIYYRNKKILSNINAVPNGYSWRLANATDASTVEILAGETFTGYSGHYHSDPNINKFDADLVYSSWAGNSCRDKAVADGVLLIENGKEIAAFATLKRIESYMFEGVLFGVSPAHQGKGLYSSLMQLAQNWAKELDFRQMIVSTQLTNLAVQKVWCRQGFEPFKSCYTLHKWFSK